MTREGVLCAGTCLLAPAGAEAGLLRCLREGPGQGLGLPAAPQSSLLILPTACSSAAQACLAQRQGHRGCRAGQEEAPALPASSLQGPGDQ